MQYWRTRISPGAVRRRYRRGRAVEHPAPSRRVADPANSGNGMQESEFVVRDLVNKPMFLVDPS